MEGWGDKLMEWIDEWMNEEAKGLEATMRIGASNICGIADNDACVFFWWTASTVRHLGIGGKPSHPSVELAGELGPYDREQRYIDVELCLRLPAMSPGVIGIGAAADLIY